MLPPHFTNTLAFNAGSGPRRSFTAGAWDLVATIDAVIVGGLGGELGSVGQRGFKALLNGDRGAVGVIGHRFSFG